MQEPDDLTRSAETPPPSLYVQAGAFSDQRNAERVLDRLHTGGLPGAFIYTPPDSTPASAQASACSPSVPGDSPDSPVRACAHILYRVRLGPISTVPELDQLAAKLRALGFPDARLATD